MIYNLNFTKDALEDISHLKRNEPHAYKKLEKLLVELQEHPRTGTGKPEETKYNLAGCLSRRINEKHRLVYRIEEGKGIVEVLYAKDHYKDK